MTIRLPRPRILERGTGDSAVALSVLDGGLRVVTESMPAAASATIGVWVRVGSVDETRRLAGVSHYLEHVLFKGTARRSARQIATEIDSIGGELNAFTSHEYTCYYAQVLADDAAAAIDVIADVVLGARIASRDVDTERTVIAEEIAMRDDDPEDSLADTFAAALFDGHPVGDPVIGSYESVGALTRTQIHGYYRRRYAPPAMVVSVAGAVDHRAVVRAVRDSFAHRLEPGRTPLPPRAGRPLRAVAPQAVIRTHDGEQAHLCAGVAAPGRDDPRRFALAVLSTAIGGGMSSRLFQRIREDRGLAYSCYTATSSYAGCGSLSVYAGCQPDNLAEVAALISRELADVVAGGLTAEEINRAKQQLVGATILSLETGDTRMSRNGKQLLLHEKYRSVTSDLAALRRVTHAEVTRLAREMLDRPLTTAVVGPYPHRRALPREIRKLSGR